MPELLLELGCEELPASFVRRAYEELCENVLSGLLEARVEYGQAQALGTPRRLIVSIQDVADRQPDLTKDVRGPAVKAAYDESGNPTKALEGFCRGQGVDPSAARTEGEYVWITKTEEGKPTRELLETILPQAIKGLTFEKAMRWGSSRMRFARPIRWILAAFGNELVPFQIESVRSGLESRGHRFNHPDPFQATTFEQLTSELRQREVEPDPAIREQRIRDGALKVCTGDPMLTDELVDENVFLTEWPSALESTFREDFLELPSPVLITAMAKHERFFPVKDSDGKISNRFVSIRNGGQEDVVRDGNAWVLNARFNDAMFFFEEDKKRTLDEFLHETVGIVFQEKLGTVRQRADRLSKLAREIALATGADEAEAEYAAKAGLYAKADLSTGLVSELASLQGVVGGEYAKREGFPDAVCWAIASQYDLGRNPNPDCPGGRTAVRLIMADQLDKLAGYLGLGLEPSGSSDPYGLRRAATLLIEAAWSWPSPLPSYGGLLQKALDLYKEQGVELNGEGAYLAAARLFEGRYESLLPEVRHDVLDAATLADNPLAVTMPRAVRFRAGVMEQLAENTAFVHTATRPLNIVEAARKKGLSIDSTEPLATLTAESLQSEEAAKLLQLLKGQKLSTAAAAEAESTDELITLLRNLAEPINTFFDTTMVMVEDNDVRYARLSLLEAACQQLLLAGDFTKIVIEGG